MSRCFSSPTNASARAAHAVPYPCGGKIVFVEAIGRRIGCRGEPQRNPEVRFLWPAEIRSHHSDHFIRLLVQFDRLAYDYAITAKTAVSRSGSKE